jgi:hypothetical protein
MAVGGVDVDMLTMMIKGADNRGEMFASTHRDLETAFIQVARFAAFRVYTVVSLGQPAMDSVTRHRA